METVAETFWSKSKILIKGFIIGVLVLLLIIPTIFVQNLVEEREQRQKEAIAEVSSKWAGQQVVTGPFIVLPYWQMDADTTKKSRTKHFAYFLPDALAVNATVTPKEKYRGIYKVMLYNSKINLSGSFNNVNLQQLNILPQDVIWNEAFVKFNLADVKGLNEEMLLKWNGQQLNLSPQSFDDNSGSNGLTATLPLDQNGQTGLVNFSSQIDINGSEQLLFTPTGKSTSVTIQSSWPHPSFKGDMLPQTSTVKGDGFSATWKSMAHKRAFPQQWKYDFHGCYQ
jgi:inner membrane protein